MATRASRSITRGSVCVAEVVAHATTCYRSRHGTWSRHLRRSQLGHQPRAAHAQPHGGGPAGRPARPRRVRHRRAPPRGLPHLLAGDRAGRGGRHHRADPPLQRGHRAELRRPGPRLPGLRRGRPALGRARGDHGRPRLVHRVLPALRLRPQGLRRPLRREARPAADASATTCTSRGRAATARRSTTRACGRGPVQEQLPVWVAVGGSPQSIVRAGTLGLPLALAIIGGQPERFVPLVDLYREAAQRRRPRPRADAGRHQHARLRRRDVRAGRRGLRRALPGDDEPHRPRARLAALGPRRSTRRCARRAVRWPRARPSRSPRRSSSSTSSSATSATSGR